MRSRFCSILNLADIHVSPDIFSVGRHVCDTVLKYCPGFSPHIYWCNHQFGSDNGLVMRRKISNVLGVIGTPLFGSTMAPRRSIAFWNSAGTWSCAPCKQFDVLDQWHDGHGWAARWSDTLLIRPVEPNTNRISRDWLTMWVYKLFTGDLNLNTANNSTKTKLHWSNICYLSVFS